MTDLVACRPNVNSGRTYNSGEVGEILRIVIRREAVADLNFRKSAPAQHEFCGNSGKNSGKELKITGQTLCIFEYTARNAKHVRQIVLDFLVKRKEGGVWAEIQNVPAAILEDHQGQVRRKAVKVALDPAAYGEFILFFWNVFSGRTPLV